MALIDRLSVEAADDGVPTVGGEESGGARMKKVLALTLVLSASALIAASPASARVCTAKNASGATYTAIGPIKVNVSARALAKCKLARAAPRTCVITSCTP